MPTPRAVNQSEKRVKRSVSRQFSSLAKDLSDRVRYEEKGLGEDIEGMIDNAFPGIVAVIVNNAKKILKIGQRRMKLDLDVEVDRNLLNKNAVRYLQALETLHLSDRDGSIKLTTKKGIINILANGVQEGKSYTDMADDILAQVDAGIFSQARAELISVREIGHAYEQGRYDTVKEVVRQGYQVEKIRSTVGDERVTDQCRANEAQGWIPESANFQSGDQTAPRNSHPRCRCTVSFNIV